MPDDEVTDPAHIILSGSGSFSELIAVTRRRDAVRRRLRAQQQQDPAQLQDEVQEEKEEQQQQQAQPALSGEHDTLDGSSDAWDAGLPLSQSLLPEWEERQRARKTRMHRLAAEGQPEQYQEQYPPNTAMQSRPHSPSGAAAVAGACAAAGVAAVELT